MALTEPLLSARHKMSYYNSGSDTAHLVAREKINMAAMPTDDEQTLSGRDTPGDDSLRKRSGASSFSSGAEADDSFIRIAVRKEERGGGGGGGGGWSVALLVLATSPMQPRPLLLLLCNLH